MADIDTDALPETDALDREAGLDASALAALVAAVADRDPDLVERALENHHPADAADLSEQLTEDQFRTLVALAPQAVRPEMLAELNEVRREIALALMPTVQIAQALMELDSDDAALVADDLDPDRRAEVFEAIGEGRERSDVEAALAFEDETAGRMMQREFVAAPEHWSLGEVIDHLRAMGEEVLPEEFFEVFVVDPAFRPIASARLSDFFKHPRTAALAVIARPLPLTIAPDMDQEDVAYAFQKYHLAQAPVVDEAGRLTGMITVDDIVDVIHEEKDEDLLALAGAGEAGTAEGALAQARARAPWLGVNLVTALAASGVISLFGGTIREVVALAILMPIVAALGGNAGMQALAVAIRAFAQRDITSANARRMVMREAGTAVMNGIGFAILLAFAAWVWFRSPALAAVIGVAMLINFVCAGLAGILVPLTMKRVGADPAVASSVFVTTITDVVGFFVFLGLATIVLL